MMCTFLDLQSITIFMIVLIMLYIQLNNISVVYRYKFRLVILINKYFHVKNNLNIDIYHFHDGILILNNKIILFHHNYCWNILKY